MASEAANAPARAIAQRQRGPGTGCDAPTFFVKTMEEQIGRLLDRVAMPIER
ncbi:MAG TPA: hypothetical protein VGR16_03770 [Thermomicrobiales bacterium]|nr:hypothetical protein [Thermomicrobiales bacterium]